MKKFTIITVIMLLCLLCSCAKVGNDLKVKISPANKSLIDLASNIYEESQLLEIVKFDSSINELNKQYPIDCLRKKSDTYRVSYLGDESIAVLIFDGYGNKLLGTIYNAQKSKSDFDKLVKGMLLEEVREIDPDGDYLFLYTGRNDIPKLSSHYTIDGYLITINYDNLNKIISIKEELI